MSVTDFHSSFAEKCQLNKGDLIYLSADVIRLALLARKQKTRFDPSAFINSITHLLGEEGTLLIPAFNYELKNKAEYDVKKTIPVTGILAKTALQLPDFRRTFNSMHSFLVWGKFQKEICNLKNTSSFAEDSPFEFLYQNKAKMLVIDLDLQSSLTFAHYSEEKLKVHYRKWKSILINYTEKSGEKERINFRLYSKKPGYINNVNPMLDILLEKGATTKFSIEGIPCLLVDLPRTHELIADDIRNNHAKNIVYFSWKHKLKTFIKQLLGRG